MRCGFCSDIDLEFRFKHMTTKKHSHYQKVQTENFMKLVQECITQKLEVLFLVGNLFAVPQPRNETVQLVNQQLQLLSNNSIRTILIPGARDTPLYFTHDHPIHYIFESIPGVSVLLPKGLQIEKSAVIKKPFLQEKLGKEKLPVRLYGFPSPFERLDSYSLGFRSSKTSLNILFIPDVSSFKSDVDEMCKNFVDNLKKKGKNIDYVVIGGILPRGLAQLFDEQVQLPFKLIHASQLHINNFDYVNQPHGLCVQELTLPSSDSDEDSKIISSSFVKPISSLSFSSVELDLGSVPTDSINSTIDEMIKKNANLDSSMLRLTLSGKINKEIYHSIQIFRFLDKGNRLNYYFELQDNIQFQSEIPDISRFNIIQELEKFVEEKITDTNFLQNVTTSEFSPEEQANLYKSALEQIKQDWKRR